MLDSTTKRRIDDARDILVGKIPDPKSQVEQITIALIYKFMDDMDTESEELGGTAKFFVGDYKKYSWRKVFNKTRGGQDILLDYREALQKMSENPSLPSIFHTIFRQAYLPYNDPGTLKEFLKIIDQFDYDHSEKLGDAFEYLLSVLGSQGDAGQFRTPRHIIDFMVNIVEPKKNETILDPACGTAGFLISSYKYILKSNSSEGKSKGDLLTPDERKRLSENISGYDISPDMVRLSLVNMYLHRITEPKIIEYDTLTSDTKWNEYFDVIFANPPFMSPKGGIKPHSRFSVQSKRSEALFVDYIAEHLSTTGRGAVIVPEGVIFKSDTAFIKLRKMLVEDNYLYGVISLPSGVFNPYSGVKTSILLFDKVISKLTDKILFAKIENDGFSLGAQRRPVDGSQLENIVFAIREFRVKLHRGEKFESNVCTFVEKLKIAESEGYNLSGERYIEQQEKSSNYEWVPIGDICTINPSKSELNYLSNINVSFVPMSDLGENRISFKPKEIRNIDEVKGRYTYFSDNDILLAKVTPCFENGKAGIANNLINGIGFGSSEFYVMRPSKVVLAEWIYYNIKTETFYSEGKKSMTGTGGLQRIPKKFLSEFRIPLPSLEEQQAIVAEIESYQRIIDAARTIIDNYRPQVTIDLRWQMVELGKVCDINPKKSEIKNMPESMDVAFVPMSDINENNISFSHKETKKLSEVYSGYTYFKDGDVLLAKVTPCFENGKAGLASNLTNGVGFGSSEFYVLRAKEHVLPQWVYICIKEPEFQKQGKNSMTGTGGLQRIPKDFIQNWRIPLPAPDIQQQIVAEIEREQAAVNSAKELIEIFTKKITNRIAQIWNE